MNPAALLLSVLSSGPTMDVPSDYALTTEPQSALHAAHIALDSDDPFAELETLNDTALREARGGIRVGDSFVDIGGLFVEFELAGTELLIQTAEGIVDVATAASNESSATTINTVFNPDLNTLTINNTRDNVVFNQTTHFNIHLTNLQQTVRQSAATSSISSAMRDRFRFSSRTTF